MGLAVGAEAPLNRFLILEIWIFEGITIVRTTQNILFEFNGIDDVVPECGVTSLCLVLVVAHKQLLSAAFA